MEEYAGLMMLGVRVRTVRELEERAIWSPRSRILFVDETLTRSERGWLVRHLTCHLLQPAA